MYGEEDLRSTVKIHNTSMAADMCKKSRSVLARDGKMPSLNFKYYNKNFSLVGSSLNFRETLNSTSMMNKSTNHNTSFMRRSYDNIISGEGLGEVLDKLDHAEKSKRFFDLQEAKKMIQNKVEKHRTNSQANI